MKQLLLRVPDDLHRRLAQRAAHEHRSVNALATEVLAVAASVDAGSRSDRLRMRVASLGMSAPEAPYRPGNTSPQEREAAVASMRGAGKILDDLLEEGKGSL